MCHAAATSFGAFFALRFLLGMSSSKMSKLADVEALIGMCESCVAPILILIITMFYKKDEQVSPFQHVFNSVLTAHREREFHGFT